MSAHTPHELHDEFPHDIEAMHWLKLGNAHFSKLADHYHALNRAIHRFETEVERCSDFHVERLKKQRLNLLDEIAVMLEDTEPEPIRA
ncbi:YdcH family protein [Erythrobacter ani]|uniref:DUF465 domain-containing protein n=1 Tax=Erythrobacter ani TaxID=2827235 RepID=A0ABS6SJU0_9SPHN|nr:DUF465 domain-containing protein [Erythrobacter ani]MBV7265274.1 DUF465 domain-containing protein [Erythrobacter ani]